MGANRVTGWDVVGVDKNLTAAINTSEPASKRAFPEKFHSYHFISHLPIVLTLGRAYEKNTSRAQKHRSLFSLCTCVEDSCQGYAIGPLTEYYRIGLPK